MCIRDRYENESSGGITYDTIRDYAEQGVDFISVGALTHSVKGLDIDVYKRQSLYTSCSNSVWRI